VWAYYALVGGVLTRFTEIILEERFGVSLKPYIYDRLDPLTSRIRAGLATLKHELAAILPRRRSSSQVTLEEVASGEDGEFKTSQTSRTLSAAKSFVSHVKGLVPSIRRYSLVKEVYACPECSSRFKSDDLLQQHMESSH
jgi:hypothetical protein